MKNIIILSLFTVCFFLPVIWADAQTPRLLPQENTKRDVSTYTTYKANRPVNENSATTYSQIRDKNIKHHIVSDYSVIKNIRTDAKKQNIPPAPAKKAKTPPEHREQIFIKKKPNVNIGDIVKNNRNPDNVNAVQTKKQKDPFIFMQNNGNKPAITDRQ